MHKSVLALLLVAAVCGCSRSIGDGCMENVECSALGDRFCDRAQPGGYCTVDSCDHLSCPDNAACVRLYTVSRAGAACAFDFYKTPGMDSGCRIGELCLCDAPLVAGPDTNRNQATDEGEVVCPGQAHCASETTERRWCLKRCDDDSDCRQEEGYRCLQGGGGGAIGTTYRDEQGVVHGWRTESLTLKFCAPGA